VVVPIRENIDAEQCSVWHKASKNLPVEEKSSPLVVCRACKALEHDLTRINNRAASRTKEDVDKRVSASSTVPLKFLSPRSQPIRARNKSDAHRNTKRQLARLESFCFDLCDDQSTELSAACKEIGSRFQPELEGVFSDAGDEAYTMRSAWESDVLAREQFNEDQDRNVSGSNKKLWSVAAAQCSFTKAFHGSKFGRTWMV